MMVSMVLSMLSLGRGKGTVRYTKCASNNVLISVTLPKTVKFLLFHDLIGIDILLSFSSYTEVIKLIRSVILKAENFASGGMKF